MPQQKWYSLQTFKEDHITFTKNLWCSHTLSWTHPKRDSCYLMMCIRTLFVTCRKQVVAVLYWIASILGFVIYDELQTFLVILWWIITKRTYYLVWTSMCADLFWIEGLSDNFLCGLSDQMWQNPLYYKTSIDAYLATKNHQISK